MRRMTTKGQVTIPIEIREQLGWSPETSLEFEVDGNAVRVTRASGVPGRGQAVVERLRGRGDIAMTTDEIMALTRGD